MCSLKDTCDMCFVYPSPCSPVHLRKFESSQLFPRVYLYFLADAILRNIPILSQRGPQWARNLEFIPEIEYRHLLEITVIFFNKEWFKNVETKVF